MDDQAVQGDDLEQGLVFAEPVRGQDHALAGRHAAQPRDRDFARQNDDYEPRRDARKPVGRGQHDQRRGHDQLVRERVEKRPQQGSAALPAGHIAVEEIREAGDEEDARGQQAPPRAGVGQTEDQERDECDAQQAEQVGDAGHGDEPDRVRGAGAVQSAPDYEGTAAGSGSPNSASWLPRGRLPRASG